MAAAIVQAATGVAVAEPVDLTATGTLGPTGVDEWTVAQLTYKGGITAAVRTGVSVQDDNAVSVYGTRGRIVLTDPWTLGDDPTIEIRTVDEPLVRFLSRESTPTPERPTPPPTPCVPVRSRQRR